jgi:NAD(P)H-hydrate epimerase
MGDSEGTRALLWAALPDVADLAHGAVIDADGLNALAKLGDGAERTPDNVVLTPHPGEMARLMQCSVADVQARRLEVAQEAAAKYGCAVVLKGAHTVVAAADGRVRLSPFANPLLATAGSGDILSGIIGGYLAQGLEAFEAASLGVYMHAAVGEALRAEMGDSGLLAGEIASRLPQVTKDIAAG